VAVLRASRRPSHTTEQCGHGVSTPIAEAVAETTVERAHARWSGPGDQHEP
jgi:hypothetical protein